MSNKYIGHKAGLIGPVPENVIESKPDFRDYDQGGQYHNAYVTWFNKYLSSFTPIPCEGWVPEPGREYAKGKDFKILRKADKVSFENDKEVITPGERFAVQIHAAAPDYELNPEKGAAYLQAAPVLPAGGEGWLKHDEDATVYIDGAIKMLKECWADEWCVAGYNGIVSLLRYAKESHQQSPTYPAEFVEWMSQHASRKGEDSYQFYKSASLYTKAMLHNYWKENIQSQIK